MSFPVKIAGKVRVAATQFGAGQDVNENLKTCLRMIDETAKCQPDIMVLPEFANHCSWYDDKAHCHKVSVAIGSDFLNAIAQKAKAYHCYICINCTLQRDGGLSTGTSILYGPDGSLLGEKDKEVLMGHENDYLERATAAGPIIQTPLGKIGMYSCMDGVIMETTRSLALRGGQILLNSLNSFAYDEGSLHIPVRAAENKVFIVAANKVGPLIPQALVPMVSQATNIPAHHLDGSGESQIVAPDGTVLAIAPRSGDTFVYADIDPSEANNKKRPDGTDIFESRCPELYKSINEETQIAEPPALADHIKGVVYQPKSDGLAAIDEVISVIENKLLAQLEAPHTLVLPELFCFEKASVRDPLSAVEISKNAVNRIQQALKKVTAPTIIITSIVETNGSLASYQHVGIAITSNGIILKQPQLHRCERHAWASEGEGGIQFKNLSWGNLAIVVSDDSIYPETFRLAIFHNANLIAVPTHITEQWELTTGLMERSAENRAAILVGSRASLGTKDGCCRIFNPYVDFTLMVPWPNRPFDGLISQPRIRDTLNAEGFVIDKEVNIKGSQNKVISSRTHLVYSRPIHNLQDLVQEVPKTKRSVQPAQNLIDGKWVTPTYYTNKFLRDASTGLIIGEQRSSSPDQVEKALKVAAELHESGVLSSMSVKARVNALNRIAKHLDSKAEEISKSDSIQTGVVINTTGLFAKLLGMIFKELAEILSREDFVVQKAQGQLAEVNVIRKPWGPALCITPWNAPAPLEAHKIAAGLAAGCPVILKPSEFSHASAQAIAQAFLESCDPVNATDNPTDIFPIGTFQILHGDASVGAQLVNDYRIACVSFTGGLHGGRAISRACADTFRPIQLELGGNNACVVLEDADLDLVGPGILAGLTTNNGQWCRAVGRILVHKSLEEKVLNKVMDIFAKLKIGDALDPTTEMGPIAHYGHLRLLKKSIDALIAKGGKVHSTTPLPTLGGNFLPPIVITGCKPEDTLDEMFGPVAVLHTFNDEKEALFLANQTPFGLSGYVYGNEQRALEFAKKMRTGDVKVNGCKLLSLARTAPRPAWGLSGYGEEGGFETLNFFCGKTVVGVANRK